MREVASWPIRSRRDLGVRTVMREWAASGRQLEAGAYFDSLTDPALRDVAAGPLVRGWALGGDAEGALALVRAILECGAPTRRRRRPRARRAPGAWRRGRDRPGENAWTRSRAARSAQKVILTTLDLAGQSDPNAAAAYYDELLNDRARGHLARERSPATRRAAAQRRSRGPPSNG